jgi:hypothetical protein
VHAVLISHRDHSAASFQNADLPSSSVLAGVCVSAASHTTASTSLADP